MMRYGNAGGWMWAFGGAIMLGVLVLIVVAVWAMITVTKHRAQVGGEPITGLDSAGGARTRQILDERYAPRRAEHRGLTPSARTHSDFDDLGPRASVLPTGITSPNADAGARPAIANRRPCPELPTRCDGRASNVTRRPGCRPTVPEGPRPGSGRSRKIEHIRPNEAAPGTTNTRTGANCLARLSANLLTSATPRPWPLEARRTRGEGTYERRREIAIRTVTAPGADRR